MSRGAIRVLAGGVLVLLSAAAAVTVYRLYLLQPHATLAGG